MSLYRNIHAKRKNNMGSLGKTLMIYSERRSL